MEVDDRLDRAIGSDSIESLGLGDGSGKSVEDVPASPGIVLLEPLPHDLDHDVVSHESAGFDDLLGSSTDVGSLADRSSQYVTGGNVRNDVVPRDAQALGALPRPLAANDDQPNAGHEGSLPRR